MGTAKIKIKKNFKENLSLGGIKKLSGVIITLYENIWASSQIFKRRYFDLSLELAHKRLRKGDYFFSRNCINFAPPYAKSGLLGAQVQSQ